MIRAALSRRPRSRRGAFALSAASGALLSLTLPPVWFWPALVGYAGLLLALEGATGGAGRPWRRAAIAGAFGFAYHVGGLWWVGAAFLVDAPAHALLLPFAVVGLPLLLAPFHALAGALTALVGPCLAERALALALALSFTEWLRSFVLTGFPWNVPGLALTQGDTLAQGAALVGLTGLAVPAVLCGLLPMLLTERHGRRLAALTLAALASLALYGVARPPPPAAAGPRVKIVQPNVAQADKWKDSERPVIWQRLLALSKGDPETAAVIWPETAIPFLWRTPSREQVELAAALEGRPLLTGAVELAEDGSGRATNSLLLIGADGRVEARYDKVHLVPFGEYLPLSGVLSALGLEALAAGATSFRPGKARRAVDAPGLPPLEPLICYEVIFTGDAVPEARWLLNVTNDAWFGQTAGPHQHLAHARLRAVERGVPLVRAANTGISALFDTRGRAVQQLGLAREGSIVAPLPPPTGSAYARLGDIPLYSIWVAFLAAAVHRRVN